MGILVISTDVHALLAILPTLLSSHPPLCIMLGRQSTQMPDSQTKDVSTLLQLICNELPLDLMLCEHGLTLALLVTHSTPTSVLSHDRISTQQLQQMHPSSNPVPSMLLSMHHLRQDIMAVLRIRIWSQHNSTQQLPHTHLSTNLPPLMLLSMHHL
jgi:hypothetical protein